MIVINENIEDKGYHYKDWYKKMDELVGENFDSTATFENSLQIGETIHVDIEDPVLPNGMTIPQNSSMTLEQLGGVTFEVQAISITGNNKTVKLGIRSTASSD